MYEPDAANCENILVVEDDAKICAFVSANLKKQGYSVELAATGAEALENAALQQPDLVLLDLGLPDLDGTEVLVKLREWYRAPVIVLSARSGERDKVGLLDLGADDYITKPFSVGELLARVRAVLRRAEPVAVCGQVLDLGHVMIDFAAHQVCVGSEKTHLTHIEWAILRELANNIDKVVTHKQLLARVWGPDYTMESGYLRTYIKQLRKKVELDSRRPVFICTEPGIGYMLRLADTTVVCTGER